MKNFIKCSIGAGAAVALAGSVYGNPTLVVEDGNAAFDTIQTSASGVVSISASDANWSVVVASGTSTPPLPGGNPSTPVEDVIITASYIGHGGGDPLIISFGNDTFGPTTGSFVGDLTGHIINGGFANVGWTIYDGSGSHLPTIPNPVPPGLSTTTTSVSGPIYNSILNVGPISLGSPYTLGDEITLQGINGSLYSIDASIRSETVPDGGMTLVFLGSAMTALGLLKKKML